MSRIGRQPVALPSGAKASFASGVLTVEGGGKTLTQEIDPSIGCEVDEEAREIRFTRSTEERHQRSLHGLYRVLAFNMVQGVTQGFERRLTIVGVGYNAKLQGTNLVLNIGFCHPVETVTPDGISVECVTPTMICIKGIDKQAVGQFAANIRRIRPPEPYKGKGIRYQDEVVRRKQGKSLGS